MSGGHRGARSRRGPALAAVLAALVLGALIVWLLRPGTKVEAAPLPAPSPTAPATTTAPARHDSCSDQATGEINPTTISLRGITAPVIGLPRDSHHVPSTPPATSTGKRAFAWDEPPGIRPGAPRGNVLLNAHTFPDGSALGNDLLTDLRDGDRIVVRGEGGTVCYRLDQKIVVPASKRFLTYFDREGPPQLAIVVCSGTRLGPGRWTHRTIWFAGRDA